ncbi:MAG: PspC domain-containing protein [Candidatus Limnocylindria bacterium]
MTDSNAEPTSAPPASAAGTARLRRRASDRVAAGVAAGVADYLNVDPLLIRVVFVGLVLFNGAGLFIYLAAWLFIPVEGRDVSIVEDWIRRLGVTGAAAGTVAWVLLGIAGTLLLIDWVRPGGQPGIHPGFALALVVITGGILLVRRTASGDASGVTDQPMTEESVAAAAPSAPTTRERRARVMRERSPLTACMYWGCCCWRSAC